MSTSHSSQYISSAPGKIILSGEHSVVYGYPAVVFATQLGSSATVVTDTVEEQVQPEIPLEFTERIKQIFATYLQVSTAEISLQLRTELPIQSGMGSSASVAAAGFQALAKWFGTELSPDQLLELVQTSERAVHGNPSGVDAAAVVNQGVLSFQKKDGQMKRRTVVLKERSFPQFFLVQTGKPVETTKEMVAFVAGMYQKSESYQKIIDQLGEVTTEIMNVLPMSTERELYPLIEKNQHLLENLGIVSEQAQQLIDELRQIGAVAKITGAGGRQAGSGLAFVLHQDPEHLLEFCQQKEIDVIQTGIQYGRTL